MKKQILITCILILGCFHIFCQRAYLSDPRQVDSLLFRLSQLGEDTNKVQTLIGLGNGYNKFDSEKAIKYHTEAMELSKKLNHKELLILSTISLGWSYMWSHNYVKAVEKEQEALKLIENKSIGSVCSANGALLMVYKNIDNYEKAKIISLEINKIGYELGNKTFIIYSFYNLGEIYEKENKLDSALYYANKADNVLRSYKYTTIEPQMLTGVPRVLGIIHSRLNNLDSAYLYFHQALTHAESYKATLAIQEASCLLSKYFQKLNQLDSAIYYAHKSMEGVDKIGNWQAKYESGLVLSKHYRNINQPDTAYKYLEMAMAAKDSLSNIETLNQIQALIIKEEDQKQEFLLKQKQLQNTVKQYALLATLGVFSIITLILYRNNKHKQKANVLLQKQKIEIQDNLKELKSTQAQLIQKEKLASLGELTAGIAHEIQNPLNFVNNFSELSVDLVKDLKDEFKKPEKDEVYIDELFDDLSQNQEKINHHGKRASSIVKGMLEHSRASTGVRELTDINKLADEYLRLSYHGLRAKDKDFNASMETYFQDPLSKIEIIPQDIGRVLLNLYNNAFYAVNQRKQQLCEGFPKGIPSEEPSQSLSTYTPSVSVTTQQLDNQIIIKVKDNGMGMPEATKAKVFQPFFTTKPTGQGTGLGLSLAYDIVTKGHGGTLEVISTEGVGSKFVIKLPIH